METQLEKLVAEALTMPAEDRASFAQLLLESLPGDFRDDDEEWEREIERRVANIENGTTKLIPMEEALATVGSRLE